MKKGFWNERFGKAEYIYGELPNEYFKEKIQTLKPGKALFPCEGEGRNAVYAATSGWVAEAFDQSEEGKNKALRLAEKNNTEIHYKISDLENVLYPEDSFDALVLIYAHSPQEKRRTYHQKLSTFLKSGGLLILEGFSTSHLQNQQVNPWAGGPQNIEMLFNLEDLKTDFPGFEFLEALETDTVLSEGEFHKGKAHVARLFARKK